MEKNWRYVNLPTPPTEQQLNRMQLFYKTMQKQLNFAPSRTPCPLLPAIQPSSRLILLVEQLKHEN